MVVKKRSRVLFLSHAAADKRLVEAFETLLAKSMGLTSANIFCSSLEGQGVPKGANFVEKIRAEAETARGVVALITPAYLDSAFCMAELGAAWVLNTARLPIVVPPNTFKVMEATLLGIVGVKIDDEDALAQAFEDLAARMGIDLPAVGVRGRAMREFGRAWTSMRDSVPPPNRIEASIHAEIVRQRDEAVSARDAAEQELSKAEAKIAALRKIKDASTVVAIDNEFDESQWEEKLEDVLIRIRDLYPELGGKEIARLLILDHFGKTVRPDHNNFAEETYRAIELGIYDEENQKWNYNDPDVNRLTSLVEKVVEIIDENPEAEKQLKSRKRKSDPRSIKFWEENL